MFSFKFIITLTSLFVLFFFIIPLLKKFIKTNTINKKIAKLFDYFMLFRPTLFFSVWVMVCIGMYISSKINGNVQINILTYDNATIALYTGISLVCGSCFILNQISDVQSDKINKKIFLLNEIIKTDKAILMSRISAISGFLIIVVTDFVVLCPSILIYLFWGVLYNDKNFEWKSNPWLGLLANILCGYFLLLSGVLFNRSDNNEIIHLILSSLIYIIPFIFAYSSIVLLANVPDTDGDNSVNKRTFTIQYGIKVTIIIATLFCLASFLIGLYIEEPLSSTSALTAIPFFLFAIFRGKKKDILRSIRYPIFLLNFYVITIYPLLVLPVMVFYYISKYYYWHRFNIHYPTLLVDDD